MKKVAKNTPAKGSSKLSSRRRLICFISAPADVDTGVLREILSEIGVQAYDDYDYRIGDSIEEEMKSKIKRAHFAIIVFSSEAPSVLYEMGLCAGLDKPMLVLVSSTSKAPFFVQNRLYLRSDLRDTTALRITLSKFIEDLNAGRVRPKKKSTLTNSKSLSGLLAERYLGEIRTLRQHGTGKEIENLAYQLFHSLGLQVVQNQFTVEDKGVDLAIWSDALSSALGNPLFIEVKAGTLSENRIREAERQLQTYIAQSDAKAAILLYLDRNGRRFSRPSFSSPFVIRFDLEDFIKRLMRHRFEEVLLAERNRIAHGVST